MKPEWLEDERIGSCSDGARMLSVALLLIADDHGRGRAAPVFIAAQVWAYHPGGAKKAADAMGELEQAGFIARYTIDGQAYYEIRNWSKHQRVDHPGKPRVPAPLDDPREDSRESRESLAKIPESLAPDLRSPISDPDHDHRPPPTAAPAAPRRVRKQVSRAAGTFFDRCLTRYCESYRRRFRKDYRPTPADKSQLGRYLSVTCKGMEEPEIWAEFCATVKRFHDDDREKTREFSKGYALFWLVTTGLNQYRVQVDTREDRLARADAEHRKRRADEAANAGKALVGKLDLGSLVDSPDRYDAEDAAAAEKAHAKGAARRLG